MGDRVDPPGCVQQNGVTSPACATPTAELYGRTPPYRTTPDVPPKVSFVDFTSYFCDAARCPPVVGNVWVYRDFNHPTATFMRTLSPVVDEQLTATLGW